MRRENVVFVVKPKQKSSGSGYERLVKYVTIGAAYALKTSSSIKKDKYQDLFTELAVLGCEVIDAKGHHNNKEIYQENYTT